MANKEKNQVNANFTDNVTKFVDIKFPHIKGRKKKELIHYCEVHGWYPYYAINKFLEKIGYKNIKPPILYCIYLYDKRIRFILYKYIGIIEEYYRAKLYNITPKDDCYYVKQFDFGKLIDTLSEKKIIDHETMVHLNSIKDLRNLVSHNRLILVDSSGKRNMKSYKAFKLVNDMLYDNSIKRSYHADLERAYKRNIYKEKYSYRLHRRIPKELKPEYTD